MYVYIYIYVYEQIGYTHYWCDPLTAYILRHDTLFPIINHCDG